MERAGEEVESESVENERPLEGRTVPSADGLDWLGRFLRVSPVGIFRADLEGRCTYANDCWVKLSGLPIEAALGNAWEKAVHPDDVPRIRTEWAEWAKTIQGKSPVCTEFRYVQPGGEIVWALGETVEDRDQNGRLLGYISTVTDISELRRVREELQHSHEMLERRVRERTAQCELMALIVAESADAMISADLTGRIVSWNRAAEKIFGYTAAEMIGRTSFVVTPVDRLEEAEMLKARVLGGGRVDGFETVRVASSGELIEVALSIFPLPNVDGTVAGMSAVVRDIREQKRAERRLHQLTGRLLRVQDEERRRLARDLHDSTAQLLAALSINLSLLHRPEACLSEEKRADVLAQSLALAETVGRELSTHAYLLHPPLLDERGLGAALRWLVDGFTRRSGVAVTLEIDPKLGRLSELRELTIFRVVQEGLTNVHRHAKSATASVGLRLEEYEIVVEVRDAGGGLALNIEDGGGVGIAGMRERLAQIGGSLAIESNGTGTTVTARIPQS